MIHYLIGVSNSFVLVVLDQQFKCVTVQNNRTREYKVFDGPGDVEEKYYEFEENITEETDYETALQFFSMQIENDPLQ